MKVRAEIIRMSTKLDANLSEQDRSLVVIGRRHVPARSVSRVQATQYLYAQHARVDAIFLGRT